MELDSVLIGTVDSTDIWLTYRIVRDDDGFIDSLIYSNYLFGFLTTWDAGNKYNEIEFMDLNFDGFKDIYVHETCNATNNCKGIVFICTPGKNNWFMVDKKFSNIYMLSVRPGKELIYSRYSESKVYEQNKYEIFRLSDKGFALVKRVTQSGLFYVNGISRPGSYTYLIEKVDSTGTLKEFRRINSPSRVNDPYFDYLDE